MPAGWPPPGTGRRAGPAVAVDLARADGRVFLNTFSSGVYVDLVRARERWEGRIGKWPALALGLVWVLRTSRPHVVEGNGRPRRLWMLFAGNCVYEPDGFGPVSRPCMDDGLLDVRLVDAQPPLARCRLIGAVLLGTLSRSRVYESRRVSALRLSFGRSPLWMRRTPISLDGEVVSLPERFTIGKDAHRLVVYRPEPSPSA